MKPRDIPVLALLLLLVTGTTGQSVSGAAKELCGHTWGAIDDEKYIYYKINVCENLKASDCGGKEAAICAHDIKQNTSQAVGTLPVQNGNNVLVFNSTLDCPESNHKIQSVINLICGKSLGTPEFIKFDECVHYFEWSTFTACKKNKFKPIKEVPCYLFDEDYKKHDLNPLIKTSGGYAVDDWDTESDLYINVCRTIGTSEGDTANCPQGSAACIIKNGKAYDVGQPKDALTSFHKERLVLHYETDFKPDFCNGHSPAVTITFICPSESTEVTSPKLTANSNCRYEVEWVTENACHTEYLESDNCMLISKERSISIDLTPLKQKPGAPYHTEDKENGYIYYLNVCGPTVAGDCTGDAVSSCQYIKSNKISKVAGSYKTQSLRYSDGTITLTYSGGEKCSSGFQRMTVITFECDENAVNEGNGEPIFSGEADCTYFFSWNTTHACPKKKEDLCHVEAGKKHFNLFDLMRSPESTTAENWEAVNIKQSIKSRFYINVCHEVLQKGNAVNCDDDAAICAVDSGQKKNLGKFLTPPRMENGNIILDYTQGSPCGTDKKIQSSITLICSPGNLESPPLLKNADDCKYEFEWHTAAACVLSKAEGDNCRVSDVQAGFYFDLSPLTKKSGSYNINAGAYDFYINVCGNVTQQQCDANSGACQVSKSDHWNIGLGNSKLSYYDGIIQLNYMGGTPYNDEKKTPRSSLITFLCDRSVDVGHPEYQKEDNYTYNFKWYTKYACPGMPVECIVVDNVTNEQYDLSSLSKVQGEHSSNWFAVDGHSKYYINVCRSLVPVLGCDPFAAVCQVEYNKESVMPVETVAINNLGVASRKPIIDKRGQIIIEYINGSECINMDGEKITYTSVVHLTCKKGATSSSPIFISKENCIATFTWYTEAACPVVKDVHGKGDCSVENPNTGFVYHFESLKNDTAYVVSGNGKTYKLNICGPVKDCGLAGDLQAAGCEFDNGAASRPVQISQTLDLSTEGIISLTYHGVLHEATGQGDKFTINFVCNDDIYPGELSFTKEEINTEIHLYNTVFDVQTAMACAPAPVDCQVTDSAGNFYDLSDLTLDSESWTAVDSTDKTKERTFYLNICKPVPYTHGCKGNAVGSCMKTSDNKSINLGVIQMSPQAQADGSLSIVYMSGDKCGEKKRYSTRINFQCDHALGSPVFQERDNCEYVFLWRTSEACPVVRVEGENCKVRDPKYGHMYDLKPLGEKTVEVKDSEYTYKLRVCGEIAKSECALSESVSSGMSVSACQVKGNTGKLAGLTNQNLIYKDDLLMLNYTGGELCHKKYNRTTLIMFHCDKTEGKPEFLKETPDCTYMFQWRTPLACSFKPVDCSFKDTLGNSYDLSTLSNYTGNWEVQQSSGSNQTYYINICMPLVPDTVSCSHAAAACLIEGTTAINIGELASAPKWEDQMAVLQYKNGDRCPHGTRNKSTTIRFKCDLNKVNSMPQLITVFENCEYTLYWATAAACPLTINTHDKCQVTNPATGYLFDLSLLSSTDGYVIKDQDRSIQLNICSDYKNSLCGSGVGVCVTEGGKHFSAGKSQSQITYLDQELRLVYEDGEKCSNNPSLKHRSVFTFVCGADNAANIKPSLVSFIEDTCTWQFSWHTSMVCEQKVKCSVQNGTSIFDLTPLIKRVDNYEVLQRSQHDDSSDFYINICKPLNEGLDIQCPPGASACKVTASGQYIDIGHSTSAPKIDHERQTVSITMGSPTPCDSDKQSNYSTLIMFHCNMGTDLGRPKFVQRFDCVYIFEWDTPLVCPDDETSSGCLLTDQQLQYTFNFTSLSGEAYKTSEPNPYYIGVCSPAQNVPSGKCVGAVCHLSGNTAFSFGNPKQMRMEYRHQEEMIVLQYTGGDSCPQATDSRQSTILFKCDEHAGKGTPVLMAETMGCSATFEWKTQLACLPRKLDCKFIVHHKTYDLRMLSSITGSWQFMDKGNKYYLNLCQRVNQGPSGCSESASVCKEINGRVQVLGQVHTQTVSVKNDVVSVNYTNGDSCGKDQKLSTTIELKCANITGKPILQRFDSQSCHYLIVWETRAACTVEPKEASMTNGIVHVQNGGILNLTSIYMKSYNVSGDIRTKDQYIYEVQLSGRENSAYQTCNGASVCQVRTNGDFTRAVGSSGKASYYLDDDDLDVVFSSDSRCGKDQTRYASSTIVFHCSPTAREESPEFLHETADCQYLFSWHTSAVCAFVSEDTGNNGDNPSDNQNQYQGLSGRSQAVGAILSILLVILVACLIVLLLYKKERRETVMYKLTNCCRRSSTVSYKYTKINTEEEMDNETEWLMEEVSSNHTKPQHENGHVRSVKAEAFTSLHVDDLDSEDEVLTIPEVRIQSARSKQKHGNQAVDKYASGKDESLIGIVNGREEKTGKYVPHKKADELNIVSFHDDSDEDMLNI